MNTSQKISWHKISFVINPSHFSKDVDINQVPKLLHFTNCSHDYLTRSRAFGCQNSRLDLDWAFISNCCLAWLLLGMGEKWQLKELGIGNLVWFSLEDILTIELFIQHILIGFTQFESETWFKIVCNVDLGIEGVMCSPWQLNLWIL